MDTVGNKAAATEISGIKVAVPNIALKVVDRAIQVHGAAGVTQFFPLAEMYAHMRTLRIADGPDEVHKMTIARRELRKYARTSGCRARRRPRSRARPALARPPAGLEPAPRGASRRTRPPVRPAPADRPAPVATATPRRQPTTVRGDRSRGLRPA